MTLLISLPKTTERDLMEAARKQKTTPEALAAQILTEALAPDPFPTLEEVVAKIKALPVKPENIRAATGSLQEHLEADPEDPEFDLEAWQRDWQKVEKEMKEISRANAIAEGFIPPQ